MKGWYHTTTMLASSDGDRNRRPVYHNDKLVVVFNGDFQLWSKENDDSLQTLLDELNKREEMK